MKRNRLLVLLPALLALVLCAGCGSQRQVAGYTQTVAGDTVTLQGGGQVYTFHGFAAGRNLAVGPQIGIVDGDKNERVYTLQQYSQDEWVAVRLHVFMESNNYSLFVSRQVAEIPEEFTLNNPDSDNPHWLRDYMPYDPTENSK